MHPLSARDDSPDLPAGLTKPYLIHQRVCPVRVDADGTLWVETVADTRQAPIRELELLYRRVVRTELVTTAQLERSIERLPWDADRGLELADAGADSEESDETEADARMLANQPPVIRFVNMLVRDAFEAGASDIHLEATRGGDLHVRFRLDGVLTLAPLPRPESPHAVVSRIKLLAELDTADRRRPQDGRVRVRLESRELDLRVATVPTLHGESIVIRLLDQGGRPVALEALGMSVDVLKEVTRLADRPHGMLLVTGPTGSGKTTTLYAALTRRRAESEKIITVEDPIEYELAGVAQVPVHRTAGVTMGSALRSILRQDPDVLMVGEMRDAETAEVAVQAAMTGHLVFSTLHTTDAIGAIPRLLDLGVPDYLVAATLEGVLAQRLVRRICDACRGRYEPPPEQVARLTAFPSARIDFTRGLGCDRCRGTGYRGRAGVFELLVVDDALRDAIAAGARRSELASIAAEHGMRTLRADGWEKVKSGVTTVEEVLRVSAD